MAPCTTGISLGRGIDGHVSGTKTIHLPWRCWQFSCLLWISFGPKLIFKKKSTSGCSSSLMESCSPLFFKKYDRPPTSTATWRTGSRASVDGRNVELPLEATKMRKCDGIISWDIWKWDIVYVVLCSCICICMCMYVYIYIYVNGASMMMINIHNYKICCHYPSLRVVPSRLFPSIPSRSASKAIGGLSHLIPSYPILSPGSSDHFSH